jgi:DNA mismatch endonuclease (patch repair protein)
MLRQRRVDTGPEQTVRRILHGLGHRFRIGNRDLPGSPDVANRSRKWAVFVHGCFWHQHPGCPRATVPKRNRAWWREKFLDNQKRDAKKCAELERLGFRALVVWECETVDERALTRRLRRLLVLR